MKKREPGGEGAGLSYSRGTVVDDAIPGADARKLGDSTCSKEKKRNGVYVRVTSRNL